MRFGLLSQWYEPEPTPTPSALARELKRRGHDIRVLTGFPNYPTGQLYPGYRMNLRRDETIGGISVRRVALFPSHGPSALGLLANYASFAITSSLAGGSWLKNVEALWVYNSPPTVGLPTWLIKSRYRPRVVMHVMDLWPESLAASGSGAILDKFRMDSAIDRWLSSTYTTADAIACTSTRQIERLLSRGVSARKLSYAPLWADESVFRPHPRDEALAASLGVTDKTVLLYAGAIGEPQGLDFLVDACKLLSDDATFHCLIAGTGRAEARLRRRAEEQRVHNISFLGKWPFEDIARLMSVGDIHFASLRAGVLSEIAMPSKIIAAMASAKPVLAAVGGDAADIVIRARAGWICTPGNVAELEVNIRKALAEGRDTLRSIGQRAYDAYRAQFAMDVGVTRLEQLLSGSLTTSHA